jgi:hypothetical protein
LSTLEEFLISIKDLGVGIPKEQKTINVCKGVLEVHHENNATSNIPIQNET